MLENTAGFLGVAMLIATIGAWLTHIIDCLQHGFFGLLFIGALFFPIGIIHGFGVWFGAWL